MRRILPPLFLAAAACAPVTNGRAFDPAVMSASPRAGTAAADGPTGMLVDAPPVDGTEWIALTPDCTRVTYRFDANHVLTTDAGAGTWEQRAGGPIGMKLGASTFDGALYGRVGDRLQGVWTDATGDAHRITAIRTGSDAEKEGFGLACTTWRGDYREDGAQIALHFLPDGVLHWQDDTGYWTDGRWNPLGGGAVHLELADGAQIYDGLIDKTLMGGESHGRNGDHRARWVVEESDTPRAAGVLLEGWRFSGGDLAIEFGANGAATVERYGEREDGTWDIDGMLVHVRAGEDDLYGGFVTGGGISGHWFGGDEFAVLPETGVLDAKTANLPPDDTHTAVEDVKQLAIEGSTWDGTIGGQAAVLRFDPKGKLHAEIGGVASDDGAWELSGSMLYLELPSRRHGEAQGVLAADGATLDGQGWDQNGTGDPWTWNAHRRR